MAMAQVALLRPLELETGDEPGHGDGSAIRLGVVARERGDRCVGVRLQEVLDAEERVVGDVEPEHLPLERQERGLVPLAQRDGWQAVEGARTAGLA